MERRAQLVTCIDGWRDVVLRRAALREANDVKRAEHTLRAAFQKAELSLGSTQGELNDVLLRGKEMQTRMETAEARSKDLAKELSEKTVLLEQAVEIEADLRREMAQRDFDAELHINHMKTLREDVQALKAQVKRRDEEIERLGEELSQRAHKSTEYDEHITQLKANAHRSKMNFITLQRELEQKAAHLTTMKEEKADLDGKQGEYRYTVERLEQEIARLKCVPDSRVVQDVVMDCTLSVLQARIEELLRLLGSTEEDLFISALHSHELHRKPLLDELEATRLELNDATEEFQAGERASMEQVDRLKMGLKFAKEDIQLLAHLVFQNQAHLIKIDQVEGENSGLRSRLEAMDVAYEELLADVAILSSSPFGQKMRRRDWDWKTGAKAFHLIVKHGGKVRTKKVRAKEVIRAVYRNIRQTLPAAILAVHDVQLDPGMQGAFDLMCKNDARHYKPSFTTLYWGAGPDVDPLRSDLMFWLLSQPWGTENAAHAHHLGAFVDGGRYRLVLVKAFVSEQELGAQDYQRVAFDPFTCVPMAVITYSTSVAPSGITVTHPLSYLRYAQDWDEDATARTLEQVSQTMGMHGVNHALAMATLRAPCHRRVAMNLWLRCKSKAIENVASHKENSSGRFLKGGTLTPLGSSRNPKWIMDARQQTFMNVMQCNPQVG